MQVQSYIRKYYPLLQFAVSFILWVLLGCIPAAQIVVESDLIDSAILGLSGGALPDFIKYAVIFVALILTYSLLRSALSRSADRHGLTVGKRLDRARVEKTDRIAFGVTETAEFRELHEKAEKAAELDSTFYGALQSGTISFVQIVTSFFVLLTIDMRTAIVLFLLLVAGTLINKNASRNTDSFWSEYMQNMRHANYLASLLLHREYAAERKIFNYHREIEDRYHQDYAVAAGKNSRLGRKRFYAELITNLFSVLYSILTVLLLIEPTITGRISMGTFIAAFSAANRLRGVGGQFYGAVFDALSSFRQLSGFFSFLQLEEEEEHPSDKRAELSQEIAFRHVTFTYPGMSEPVLNDVSFTLQAGRHYALVGENGSGKTTLVKLLLGLYQPTKGSILVGGKDIKEMTRDEKRQLFSAIFQDFYRYPLSVRENISLGGGRAQDDDEIRTVLHALDFHAPFLFQPDGLDRNLNLLKQESVDMSGGEWQKITVARSVLSPAPIVVLDEPNAALDPLSEEAFYRVYEEMSRHKTTLFISHRLGAVKSADCILVLKDHHIIAMDAHDALMGSCPYYRNLFDTQRGLYYGNNA